MIHQKILQLRRARSTSIHGKNYCKVFLSKSIEELQFGLEYYSTEKPFYFKNVGEQVHL